MAFSFFKQEWFKRIIRLHTLELELARLGEIFDVKDKGYPLVDVSVNRGWLKVFSGKVEPDHYIDYY